MSQKIILSDDERLGDIPFTLWEDLAKLKGKTLFSYYYKFPDIEYDEDEEYNGNIENPVLNKMPLKDVEKLVREDMFSGGIFLTHTDYGDVLNCLDDVELYEQNFLRSVFTLTDELRTDIDLINLLETKYSSYSNCFKIVEIPDDIDWVIDSNDEGHEWVAEVHRTWGRED